MAKFSALLDACVIVPIAPCDTLLRVADAGYFRPLWSEKIIAETRSALIKVRPNIDPNRFETRFHHMNEAFPDAMVRGWESLVAGIHLPDPDDRHVVAAAIVGRADAIITANRKDFPQDVLADYGIEAISPDDFLLDQLDLHRDLLLDILRRQAHAAKSPPISVEELLEKLEKAGVPRFANEVRQHM